MQGAGTVGIEAVSPDELPLVKAPVEVSARPEQVKAVGEKSGPVIFLPQCFADERGGHPLRRDSSTLEKACYTACRQALK